MTSLKLDAMFFKPFVDGTLKVLKTTCNVDATAQKPFIKGSVPQTPFEIAGVIGLTSSGFVGTITICFSEKLFLTLMNNMLGENHTAISNELQDGAAEILNMIFGQAKVVLNEQGHTIQKAIPTVIRGSQLQTSHLGGGTVMVIPFTTVSGNFNIEISAEGRSLS